MVKGHRKSFPEKYRALFLSAILLLISLWGQAQFNPAAHIAINDALGQTQIAPIEGRSMFWDATNFRWRDFQNTTEVLTTLPTTANRFSHFPIWIHVGGTLSGGIWTGGISQAWFFKNGTADSNLVRWYTDSTSGTCAGCLLAANNLNDVGNAASSRANLGLGSISVLSSTAGGTNLSGTWPDPLVVRFNGQLPSYYLNFNNLTNTPAPLSLTTSGSSGAATYNSGTGILNIPVYTGGGGGVCLNCNADTLRNLYVDISANRNGWLLGLDTVNGKWTLYPPDTAGGGGSGITSLNSLTASSQTFATGTAGSDFGILSSGTIHTFNLPVASALNTGKLSSTDWSTFNGKINLTSLSASSPLLYNNTTGIFSEQVANTSQSGYLTSTDWNTFNGKQGAITLTTTGSSGAATFIGNTLNIPNYSTGGGFTNPMTTNGDMIYQVGGTYGRLAVAAHAGMKLTSGTSGAITWQDTTAGGGGLSQIFVKSPTPLTILGTDTVDFSTVNANTFLMGDSVSNGTKPVFRKQVVKDLPITHTWPAPTTLNDIYNKSYWTSNDLSDFLINASGGTASSLTVTAAGLLTSTASGAAFNNYNYVLPNRPSMINHWTDTMDFQVTAFGNGFATTFHAVTQGVTCYLTTTSGASTLNMSNQAGSGTFTTAVAGPTITLNHVYETVLTLNDSVLTYTARDLTTGGSVFTQTFNIPIASGKNFNSGYFGFFTFSGTHVISKIRIASNEIRNSNLCIIGDSKTKEYTPTSFAGRYAQQLGTLYPPYNLYAGSSMTIGNILGLKYELLSLNPENVILHIGSNDVRASTPLPQIEASFTTLYNNLAGGGAHVYIILAPEDSTGGSTGGGVGLTNFKNWLAATYPAQWINIWDTLSTANVLKSAYNGGDGIHLNQAGNNVVFGVLNATGLFSVLDPSRLSPIKATDGQVNLTGDSLNLAWKVNRKSGFAAIWNSNLDQSTGVLQDNGTQSGVSAINTNFTPLGNLSFTVNGGIGLSGASGGLTFTDRSSTSTPEYGLYASGSKFNINASATSRDIIRTDSLGRLILNLVNSSLGSRTLHQAFIEIGSSNGAVGNIPLIIDSGTLVSSPVSGAIENNASNLFWTDHLLNRDTIADRGWVRSILGAGGSTNIGSTQNATSYSLTSSTGTGTTLAIATSSLAGLYDTATKHFVDSLKSGSKTFNLYAANGLTAAGGDSIYWGGTLNQTTTIHAANNSISLGTTTTGDSISSFNLYANNASIRSINTGLLGNIAFQTSGTTGSSDANTSVGIGHNMILSAAITANRTLTLGDPTVFGTGSGRELTIEIQTLTSNAFHWASSPAIYNGSSADSVISLCNGATYEVYSDGARWVMKAASYGSTGSLESSSGSLTLSSFIQYIFTGSTTTWTLPPLNGNQGRTYHIKNTGSGNITLGVSGSDHIYDTSQVTSVTISPGAVRTVYASASNWNLE